MNKFKSTKLWCLIWASGLITFIVASNRVEFLPLALALSAIPIAYGPVNVSQKKIFEEKKNG